jgi:3-deoxy-D-manno-octulosonic-acid transferase
VVALYNLLLLLAAGLATPVAVPWLAVSPRARQGLRDRLRPLPAGVRADVWLHAASVGETEAAMPLLAELAERGISVVATTQTVTGRDNLRRRLPGLATRLVPLDVMPLVRPSFARVRPRVLVVVETELWPNLIWAARDADVSVVLVSARISDRSLPRYRRVAPLVRRVLAAVDAIGARSEEDAARFVALGAPPERVRIVGDLKLDRLPPPEPGDRLCEALGKGPLFVAGSTHAGEEEVVLAAWEALRAGPAPGLRLVLAPRHVERASAVARLARERGFGAALRTAGGARADVVVLDTVGELASVYHRADLVFCGGSLVAVGGHNLLEPVQAGRVVVCGPHLENQRNQLDLLEPFGVIDRVSGFPELYGVLERIWVDPERHRRAREAAPALARHAGAAHRALELVLEQLGRDAPDA